MNNDALPELAVLGWTGADLARWLDCADRTVSRWRTGKIEVPHSVRVALRCAVLIHEKGYRVP